VPRPGRRTFWAASIARSPARISSPAVTCLTIPTKREPPFGATTSATTWDARRTSPSPGRASSAYRDQRTARRLAPASKRPEVFGTTNDANYDVVGKMGLSAGVRLPEEYGPPTISLKRPRRVYKHVRPCSARSARVSVPNSIAPFTEVISWQKRPPLPQVHTEIDRAA
jgi:hypothetical protein